GRELGIALLAEVVNVRTARQDLLLDLDDRAEHHQMPVGASGRDGLDEMGVQALVEDAVKAEAWMRNRRLIFGVSTTATGLLEIRGADAARKRMNMRVLVALRLIEAVAAGEDEIRSPVEFAFEPLQLRRCSGEVRELIHAIVDRQASLNVPR